MQNVEDDETNSPLKPQHDILGAISYAQQSETLRTFDPYGSVSEYLEKLPARERQVLEGRYGLSSGKLLTLEEIGQKLELTRERIRQIEKDAMKKLRALPAPDDFKKATDLVFQFIEDRGNVAGEQQILSALLTDKGSEIASRSVLFIMHASPQFNFLKENEKYHQSWYLAGLDLELLDSISAGAAQVLESVRKPSDLAELVSKLKRILPEAELETLHDEAIESYLVVSKKIGRNPFGEFGLASWPQIKPRDVGDKAFLVLSHLGQPEHYEKIAELINKRKFDERTAHKESVHNELIKDNRFVLVGRGIYGLAEWGYEPGVVTDIIHKVISDAGRPLSKEEIVNTVLKQRMVKRNTVIVGLSNKHKFVKTPENKYTNVQ